MLAHPRYLIYREYPPPRDSTFCGDSKVTGKGGNTGITGQGGITTRGVIARKDRNTGKGGITRITGKGRLTGKGGITGKGSLAEMEKDFSDPGYIPNVNIMKFLILVFRVCATWCESKLHHVSHFHPYFSWNSRHTHMPTDNM